MKSEKSSNIKDARTPEDDPEEQIQCYREFLNLPEHGDLKKAKEAFSQINRITSASSQMGKSIDELSQCRMDSVSPIISSIWEGKTRLTTFATALEAELCRTVDSPTLISLYYGPDVCLSWIKSLAAEANIDLALGDGSGSSSVSVTQHLADKEQLKVLKLHHCLLEKAMTSGLDGSKALLAKLRSEADDFHYRFITHRVQVTEGAGTTLDEEILMQEKILLHATAVLRESGRHLAFLRARKEERDGKSAERNASVMEALD